MSILPSLRWSRRDLLRQSGLFSAFGVTSWIAPRVAAASEMKATPLVSGSFEDNLYTRMGVRPLINARGTFTIISGSCSLPEVKQAMYEASFYFVQLDELMEAVGAELGQLTGAEWGIATTGCEAAIALATLACIAGTDPEKSQALPYIKARDQVIVPRHSRNPYDFGIRMTGCEIVEVDSDQQLRDSISARTAMIYILSGLAAESGPLSIPNICRIAKEKGVPVFVDAAAEEPLSPNIHIQHGATLVGYSGGKCMRGPQSSGMLIGQKDLCRAAYFQAAPHHNYGRAFKCSKEEIMGLLAAVRQWYRRDHAAEQRQWHTWLKQIETAVTPLASVTTELLQPEDLSNRAPQLRIHWDAKRLGTTGTEVQAALDAGTPRIMVASSSGSRPDAMASSLTIMPYMMAPGDAEVVAGAIHNLLTHPAKYAAPVAATGDAATVAGKWEVTLQYMRGTGHQHFTLQQDGQTLTGSQQGELYKATLHGTVAGNRIKLYSEMPVSGNSILWSFDGLLQGNTLTGTAGLGEYGTATWKAIRL